MVARPYRDILGLFTSLIAVAVVATVGALFGPGTWYAQLAKPTWTPPNWLFGPVWTLLYIAMAVAAWLVWRERTGHRRVAVPLVAYTLQLVANGLWSWFFFGHHRIGLALADITLMWVLIAVTIALFWPIRRAAAWLLVPYLAWVSYAGALNWALWRLNG